MDYNICVFKTKQMVLITNLFYLFIETSWLDLYLETL